MAGPRNGLKTKTISEPSTRLSHGPCRKAEIRLLANPVCTYGRVLSLTCKRNPTMSYVAGHALHIVVGTTQSTYSLVVGTTQSFSFGKASWVTPKTNAVLSSAAESSKTMKNICRRGKFRRQMQIVFEYLVCRFWNCPKPSVGLAASLHRHWLWHLQPHVL